MKSIKKWASFFIALNMCISFTACRNKGQSSAESSSPSSSSILSESGQGSTPLQKTKRVGKYNVGFVDIPGEWVNVQEQTSRSSMRFANLSSTKMITLDILDRSTLDESEKDISIEELSKKMCEKAKEDETKSTDSVESIISDIADTKANGIRITYSDGTVECKWYVEDESGIIHYIAVDGPSTVIDEMVAAIEESYSFNE